MKASTPDWWMRYRVPVRAALLPLRAGWSIANRNGWLPEPPVGSEPHLHPLALDYWRSAIGRAAVYVEYGAGGSTVEAVRSVQHVFSVETDKRYLETVERRVAASPHPGVFHPIWIDVGWTSKWGQPVLARPTDRRLERWRQYPGAPWQALDKLGLVPDFIFVDGRFRLASILESLVRLPDNADCPFMLDDFKGRGGYEELLAFAEDVIELGDAIAFRRRRAFDRAACLRALEQAYADPL